MLLNNAPRPVFGRKLHPRPPELGILHAYKVTSEGGATCLGYVAAYEALYAICRRMASLTGCIATARALWHNV